MEKYDVIVVGAGPTGIFATLNINNKKVLLIDANSQIGGKIAVSGGGRCNVANNKEVDNYLDAVYKNEKFLYSTLNNYNAQDIIDYLKKNNIELKEEGNNKIFPKSNDSMELINFFKKKLHEKSNVNIKLNCLVERVVLKNNEFIVNEKYFSKYLVFTTGGVSYSHISYGYTGHEILKELNHTVTKLLPASSPLVSTNDIISSKVLQGITLKKVTAEIYVNKKKKKYVQGDILITHFGLSGPVALNISGYIKEQLENNQKVELKLILNNDIPKKIKSYLDENNSINFNIVDIKGFKTAFLTNGGISLKEVNSSSLESKICPNLYIGGEILDIHAITGGYNIAICMSEGKLIADKINEK